MLEKMVLLNKQLLAKESDVSKVKLQVAQNTTLRENFGSKYDQVLNMLKFAMGIQLEQNLKIDPTIQYQKKSEYTQNSTLDIRIVEIQNRLLSNELITLNRSKNLPSLNLVGTYGTTGFGYNGLPTSFLDFYTIGSVSYTHLRAHETVLDLVCRLLLEKKKNKHHTKVSHLITLQKTT